MRPADLSMTGSGSKIGILATDDNGTSSTTGTITYTDGTSQSFPIPIADWWSSAPAPGSDLVVTLPYLNASGGRQGHPVNIYRAPPVHFCWSLTVGCGR
jgi:beta-glucosidase